MHLYCAVEHMTANTSILHQRHDFLHKKALLQAVEVVEDSQLPWMGLGFVCGWAVSVFTEVQKLLRVLTALPLALSQPQRFGGCSCGQHRHSWSLTHPSSPSVPGTDLSNQAKTLYHIRHPIPGITEYPEVEGPQKDH